MECKDSFLRSARGLLYGWSGARGEGVRGVLSKGSGCKGSTLGRRGSLREWSARGPFKECKGSSLRMERCKNKGEARGSL